ncbi:MAG: hypothetical protein WDN31_04845 [Hyphomicrobium sp.]
MGKGRRFLKNMHPVANGIIGGWQLSGINTLQSGQPVNLTYNPGAAPGLHHQSRLARRHQLSPQHHRSRDDAQWQPGQLAQSGNRRCPDGRQPALRQRGPQHRPPPGPRAARLLGAEVVRPAPAKAWPSASAWRPSTPFNRTNFGNPQINRSVGGFGQIRQDVPRPPSAVRFAAGVLMGGGQKPQPRRRSVDVPARLA